MNEDADLWMRDWMVIGGVTSSLAPLMATQLISFLELDQFIAVAGVLGALSGLAVGYFLHSLLRRVPRHGWVAVSLFVGVPLMGAWGASVSLCAASLSAPKMAWFTLDCGSVSGLLQCGWLAPLYAWLSAREARGRLPIMLGGALFGAPVCGIACVLGVLGTMQLVQTYGG